jgi:hypothetical protein
MAAWLFNPVTKFTDPVKNQPVAGVANQAGHKFTDPAKIDPWHTWLFNPVTNLLILLKLTHGTRGYSTQSQNLLTLLTLTRDTGGYLTQSQNLLTLLKLICGIHGTNWVTFWN